MSSRFTTLLDLCYIVQELEVVHQLELWYVGSRAKFEYAVIEEFSKCVYYFFPGMMFEGRMKNFASVSDLVSGEIVIYSDLWLEEIWEIVKNVFEISSMYDIEAQGKKDKDDY